MRKPAIRQQLQRPPIPQLPPLRDGSAPSGGTRAMPAAPGRGQPAVRRGRTRIHDGQLGADWRHGQGERTGRLAPAGADPEAGCLQTIGSRFCTCHEADSSHGCADRPGYSCTHPYERRLPATAAGHKDRRASPQEASRR
jgi:hypothetical protein